MNLISTKIELFRQGKITENSYFIDYDIATHQKCYELLYNYWDPQLQYYSDNIISSGDISGDVQSDIFPISGEDFNTDMLYFSISGVENMLGIDFQNDFGITGSAYLTLSADIDQRMNTSIDTFSSLVSGVTGDIVQSQITFNENIYLQESKETLSNGIMDLMKIIADYLDSNGVYNLYKEAFITAMNAGGLLSFLSEPEYNDLLIIVLDAIYRKSRSTIGKRIEFNKNNQLLYSKLSNQTIENFIPIIFYNYSDDINYDLGLRITKVANSLMLDDESIFNNTNQNELFLTTESIINEVDIYKNVAIKQGYIDG